MYSTADAAMLHQLQCSMLIMMLMHHPSAHE
jgi:hypothetical protein